jgi:hypothetical protein
MNNLIVGETADDCLVKTMKSINRRGVELKFIGAPSYYYFPHPVTICLKNPLMRFSLIPEKDPRIGIVLGIAALAGTNEGILVSSFNKIKAFLPRPCLRGFNGDYTPYRVDYKNAGTRIGNVDQLSAAVSYLKETPGNIFCISFMDPKKPNNCSANAPVSMTLHQKDGMLSASVYLPELDVCKWLVDYIIPVFTIIQQIIAGILGINLGSFYIISDKIFYADNREFSSVLEKPLLSVIRKSTEKSGYIEGGAFDLRYLDMAIQYITGFFELIKKGNIYAENPFISDNPLPFNCFHDFGEAFRLCEARERNIALDEEKYRIRHDVQLAYYFLNKPKK